MKGNKKEKMNLWRIVFGGILLGIPVIAGIIYGIVGTTHRDLTSVGLLIPIAIGIYLIGFYLF